jgi:2-polyprenyl-3-methyl-5-hydroxy-6-metoxy-1,4-benzoquinol methylase
MDQPDLGIDRHHHALRGLARCNQWSRSSSILWRPIERFAKEAGRPVRLLDLACGAGDLAVELWRRGQEAGLPLDVHACDISDRAIEFARERAAQREADVRVFALDALAQDIPRDYDVLTCSLFLHHLNDTEAEELLRRMAAATRKMVLVNDLTRGLTGLLLAHIVTRILTTSDVVHTDAPLSVKAAFKLREVRELARRVPLPGATVSWRWPCRFLLMWRRT